MGRYDKDITFFLIDIPDIKSDVPRSQFDENKLEQLADLILSSEYLLHPLILEETGPMAYRVIQGHFEYYAAVIANKKDKKRILRGTVSAFVLKPEKLTSIAIEQIKYLNQLSSKSVEQNPPTNHEKNDSLEHRFNNLEERLNKDLHEIRATHQQDIKRLDEQDKSLKDQIKKPLTPSEGS